MITRIETTCCISGGGPAGLMLGLLLARAGIAATVIEKHGDFLRDFRGDTIHPSTMEVMHEIGLLDELLRLPHQVVPAITAQFSRERIRLADFSHLPVRAPYIAMMPQWDFLDFLARHASRYSNFRLLMQTEAVGLLHAGTRISGVKAVGPDGEVEIAAPLNVACDGRDSVLRKAARMTVDDLGAPIDVLWFRLSRQEGDTDQTQGRFDAGRIFIMLNRGGYWQCAFVIPKGADARVRAAGLAAFKSSLRPLLPIDPARADEITEWDQVKLLIVQVNRLKQWWAPGLLCIGDAAHAMSPVGGVGVNLAIQDAVAAANVLVEPLRMGTVNDQHLAAVQYRREWPTRVTQRLQVVVQNRVLANALTGTGDIRPPWMLRVMTTAPLLRQVPARLIGLGVRPEHVAPNLRAAA